LVEFSLPLCFLSSPSFGGGGLRRGRFLYFPSPSSPPPSQREGGGLKNKERGLKRGRVF